MAGIQNCASRAHVAKLVDQKAKEMDALRWSQTPEGQLSLAKMDYEQKIELVKSQLEIGQLVWKDIQLEGTNWKGNQGLISAKRCGRVIDNDDDEVIVEMLWVQVGENKATFYNDSNGDEHVVGDHFKHKLSTLEYHKAKTASGSIWWKVK
jgi:hypothetical protein